MPPGIPNNSYEAKKGRFAMQPTSLSRSMQAVAIEFPRNNEDWAYQAFTVAAILVVLASLWVF